MKDRTEEGWFERKKNDSITITPRNRRNILRSLLVSVETPQTIRAEFLNSGKPSILHYIGRSQWVNVETGYVHDWDGAHVCDRCGKRMMVDFSASTLETALFKDEIPRVALMGLCPNCEREMVEEERMRDMREGLIRMEKGGLFLERKRQRVNDFDDWMWIDSRRVEQRARISDRVA